MTFSLEPIEVRTTRGHFVLAIAGRSGKSKRRTAAAEEAAQAWFFFEAQLEYASPSGLRPVLALYEALTGDRASLEVHAHRASLERVLAALRLALRSGRLRFEVIEQPKLAPLWAAAQAEAKAEAQAEAEAKAELETRPPAMSPSALRAAHKAPPLVWYEVCLLDYAGNALKGVDVRFSCDWRTISLKTNRQGVARFEEYEEKLGELNLDPKSLKKATEPLWDPYPEAVPFEGQFVDVLMQGELSPHRLKCEHRTTLVV